MIELTRINGTAIVVNSDLIKTAEASPDTMLTLINGEKMIVREECGVVIERVLAYRARLLAAVERLQHSCVARANVADSNKTDDARDTGDI